MKKKILILLITVISFITFIPKTEAIVMWMQCTEDVNGSLEYGEDDIYKSYNTFAAINNKNKGEKSGASSNDIRYVFYNPNNFYGGKMPVLIMHENSNGYINGTKTCWFQNNYDDIEECEKEDKLDENLLAEGICPVGVRQNDSYISGFASIFTQGVYDVIKDFVVLYGESEAKSSNVEMLDQNIFIIYPYKKEENNEVYYMIEGYRNDGIYGWTSTWDNFETFKKNIKLETNDDSDDLIDPDEWDTNRLNWTSMTQLRRIKKLGRDYFKLLDKEESWLINIKENKFKKVNDDSLVYYSDDRNENFKEFAKNWFTKYETILSKQISTIESLEKGNDDSEIFESNSKYEKLIDAAKEIEKKVVDGKKYIFKNDYNASQMVEDLNEAYSMLNDILGKEEAEYEYYDSNCEVADDKTSKPLEAISSKFFCEKLGISDLENLKIGKNNKKLNDLLISTIGNTVDQITTSEFSITKIRSQAEKYAVIFATATKYIKKNESLSIEAEKIMSGTDDLNGIGLEQKYNNMTSSFNVEIIIDCEDLIGDDLRNEINSYFNIIKIAIPIILMGLGIIDFTKAMFAGDAETMKKAQSTFIKRIGIAILIFLVPTFINIILGIANKVWYFIQPGACGIFE